MKLLLFVFKKKKKMKPNLAWTISKSLSIFTRQVEAKSKEVKWLMSEMRAILSSITNIKLNTQALNTSEYLHIFHTLYQVENRWL